MNGSIIGFKTRTSSDTSKNVANMMSPCCTKSMSQVK